MVRGSVGVDDLEKRSEGYPPMTLEQLLEWAKEMGLYTQIFANGEAQVQLVAEYSVGPAIPISEGKTLLEALQNAWRELAE